MQIALLGLSTTGRLITEKLLADGHEVVVWNNTKDELENIRIEKAEFVVNQKLTIIHGLEELQNILRKPRLIWSMQSPGEPTETLLSQINNMLEAGDIVIDASDSNFKDSDRHFEEFGARGIRFLGIGVAGGVNILENGACLMVGGNSDAYQYVGQVLESLAKPNGIHTYFGTGGAGHYVKMVHNGIEAGMAQAIAEGISLLNKSDYQIDPGESAYTWQEGGIISSFMLDMVMDVMEQDPTLSQFSGHVELPRSAISVIDTAKAKNIPIPITEQAVEFQKRSQYDQVVQGTFVAKMIQAMRIEWEGQEQKKENSEMG